MRREYTTQIIVRCTPEERARWKALAERLEAARVSHLAGRDYWWNWRREEITLSALVRQLLEERLKAAAPGAPAGRPRRRNVSAAAGPS